MSLPSWLAILVSSILACGCGYVPSAQSGVASAVRSPSPSPVTSATAANSLLAAGDCVAAATGNRTPKMGRDQFTVQIPAGWTDTSSTVGPTETMLLQITAPSNYGPDAVVVQLHSFLGPRPGSTSHQELAIDSADLTDTAKAGRWASLGVIADCTVGGEGASFQAFSRAPQVQYRVYVLHHPDQQYPLLYGAEIFGNGGVDDQSMMDVKRFLGSWTWGS